MALTATDLASPLASYAEAFHTEIGDGHHVASPLGAWMLLALVAPSAQGAEREKLVEVLGTDPDEAAATTAALLSEPHPLVRSAAAVWHRSEVNTSALAAWLARLPAAVETAPMPTQMQADVWAHDHTVGLIEQFPLGLTDDLKLLLASALATRVSWTVPFELVPASQLGPRSRWTQPIDRVLRTPVDPITGGSRHDIFITSTARAGDVAVHTALARHDADNHSAGLWVTSVIAAPDVSARDVMSAAYDVATAPLHGATVNRRSLFDLPLGDGAAWTITEEPADSTRNDLPERHRAVLPAWSAKNDHDLTTPALGFPAAAAALEAMLPEVPWEFKARQSAVARYDRTGFEAAATTTLAGYTVARVASRSGMNRVADVRFGHPYGVVAVASDTRWDPATNVVRSGPWHGIPTFSAWVAKPDDATDDAGADEAA